MKAATRLLAPGVAILTVLSFVGLSPTDSGAALAASTSPVKIGFIASETGVESAGESAAIAAAKARVDEANATGGINGHKISLVVADDQSSPQGAVTAAQSLVSQGVAGILFQSTAVEGPAEQYLSSHGIPMAALGADPTEIADPELFSIEGASGPSVPGNTSLGKFFNTLGVTKVAGVTVGSLSVAVALLEAPLKAASKVGVQTVLNDLSPALTTTDFTSDALKVKASGAQGSYEALLGPQNIALATALSQQGVHLKAAVYAATNYESSTLADPNEPSLEGTYLQYWFAPMETKTPAVEQYKSVLAKYAKGTFGGLLETIAYVETDLLLKGVAGVHGGVTPSSLTHALNDVSSYTGAGLIPQPVNFTISKTASSNLQKCYWYPEILHRQFVVHGTAPVCGSVVKN